MPSGLGSRGSGVGCRSRQIAATPDPRLPHWVRAFAKSSDRLGRSAFHCRTCVTMAAEVLRMIPTNDSPEPDDRQLVEQIRHGDEEAFETLVRRKTSKVYSLCYRVIGNSEDAKDISQLVFIKLWENLEKYDAQYAFDTWLYRMVTNVAIDFLRNKQSRENAVNSNLRLVKTSTDAEQSVVVQRKEIENVFNAVSSVLSP